MEQAMMIYLEDDDDDDDVSISVFLLLLTELVSRTFTFTR
jgi:hypothetical protein